ncbi:hypothetical protein CBF34_05940 [Vagococcus penaei]|uniref:Uncharacterized protein n=1 Tax=Vagococcus penaei TaxID=633807 RepID=A0A1Q2D3M5_9ENTE|nr:hypothetical protein [Vagococcus penaei]AQP52931.1 hypothetical protein BW732_00950 [Vagococcus penaei]RSU02612.1 hypothetical protein CBF34_05940 [Vagococcus penaei]
MTYFKFECRSFFLSKKNIAIYLLLFCFSLFYWLNIEANYHSKEEVLPSEISARVNNREKFVNRINPNDDLHPEVRMVLTLWPPIIEVDKNRLDALEKEEWQKYAENTAKWYEIETPKYKNPRYYTYGNYYANMDEYFGRESNKTKMLAYSQPAQKKYLTLNVLNDKTAWQSLVRATFYWLPVLLMLVTLFFSMDLISKDRKHYSIHSNIPISQTKRLLTKISVTFLGVLVSLIPLASGFIGIGMTNGFGSLHLPVSILYRDVVPKTLSIQTYLGYFSLYMLLWILCLIVLSLLLGLWIKNEVILLLVLSVIPFVDISYNKVGFGDIYPIIAWLPTSYTRIGEVLTGYRCFTWLLPVDNHFLGLQVLSVTLIVLLGFLWLVTRKKRIV